MLTGSFLNYNDKIKKKIIKQSSNAIIKNDKIYTLDGEDVSHLYNFSLGVKTSEKKLENYKSKKVLEEHEKENGGFIFMFYRMLESMSVSVPKLTKSDIARLILLSTYISYEDNKIQYDNGQQIDDNQLAKLLRMEKRYCKKYIKKLEDSDIITIDEDGNRFLNKLFCKYGKIDIKSLHRHNISYVRLFKKTVRDLFNKTPIRELGRLSIIYMILPYLNLATNIVSTNPEEKDVDKVAPMTIGSLAEHLGYKDVTKFRQSLYNIKISESVAFGFFLLSDDRRSMNIVVNPDVVFAGNAEQLKVIKVLFKGK